MLFVVLYLMRFYDFVLYSLDMVYQENFKLVDCQLVKYKYRKTWITESLVLECSNGAKYDSMIYNFEFSYIKTGKNQSNRSIKIQDYSNKSFLLKIKIAKFSREICEIGLD